METIRYPNTHVILRNLNHDFPVISHGEGPYLYDTNGKKYFDGSGGALVVSTGHGNSEIVDAIAQQLRKVSYVNGTQFTSQPTEELARLLSAHSPDPKDLNRMSFLCSGSEATEAGVKFARQLWMERGKPERFKLIARVPSYHGNTLYALSASARKHYKKYFGPLLHEVITVSAPYEYRSPVSDYQKEGADYYVREMEETILKEGPETIAAFIFEPIIGSSAGASLPPQGYYEKMQALCRKYEILMIADEIMCGAGRSGEFFASHHFGLKPDILLMGKGISGGYAPLSAVMVRNSHLAEMKKGTGYFMHAQTYMQAPVMTAAGLATLQYYEKYQLVSNSKKQGKKLHHILHQKLDSHPHVGCISGKGLFAGIELVENKKTKAPFGRSKKIAENLTTHCFEKGLIVWPNIGQADGVSGDLIMLGPPLTLTDQQTEELAELVSDSIHSFFNHQR